MRYKLLCCRVFYREMRSIIDRSEHTVMTEFIEKGIHDLGGEKMARLLQERLDGVDEKLYDAVLLGYGLCGNGLSGLRARKLPLVLPRAHDCIGIFLGGHQGFMEQFTEHPDTYYLTTGWMEPEEPDKGMGNGFFLQMGSALASYQEMVDRYGEEVAEYMAEELGLRRHPTELAFIEMGVEPDTSFEEEARRRASEHQCVFRKLKGNMTLLERLVNGPWDEKDFLVVPPGHRIESDPVSPEIVKAVK